MAVVMTMASTTPVVPAAVQATPAARPAAREVNRRIGRMGGLMGRPVGSHRRYVVTYKHADGSEAKVATTVPQHQGDIPIGTLRAIERDLEPAFRKGAAEVSDGGYAVVVTRKG